jgi:hypothetical protein
MRWRYQRRQLAPQRQAPTRRLTRSAVVHVLEDQHSMELALCLTGEAALGCERVRVLVRPKGPVLEREIGKIILVHIELVVDRMYLGCLDDISHPPGHF